LISCIGFRDDGGAFSQEIKKRMGKKRMIRMHEGIDMLRLLFEEDNSFCMDYSKTALAVFEETDSESPDL